MADPFLIPFPRKRIHDIPVEERPRERLRSRGAKALSDLELLALMLGRGSKKTPLHLLAERVLHLMDLHNGQPPDRAILELEGIGPARAAHLIAAIEFARRRIRPEGIRITGPGDVFPLLSHYADRKQEHFFCISLNGAREVIRTRVVSVGLLNKTQVHPREVFADAITDRAASVIVAHNHPSGNTTPSPEDREITHRLRGAGELLGIQLLDHIVFSSKGFHSFLENGDLDP